MSEGKKYDSGKAPVRQGFMNYFPNAIVEVAKVSQYGATKYEVPYEDKNWMRLPNAFQRYSDGMDRHSLGEAIDGLHDPESGLLHAAHAAWNAMARLELLINDLRKT